MGALILNIGKDEDINSVIDLGAGQGYLSRTMAYQYDFQVIAVDESEVQTCGAKRFDNIAVKGYKHKETLLHHVKDRFTNENAAMILSSLQQKQHSFCSVPSNPIPNEENKEDEKENEKNQPWLICGLHACGDLSSIMLRLFIQQPDIQAIVNVGCCYHFLTHDDILPGFPMSQTVQETGFKLGSIASMLACQTPSRWLDQRDSSIKAFEHHFFRALLQWIMVKKGLISATEKAPIIGRLNKKKDFDSFPIYVKAALHKLKMDPDVISMEESKSYYEQFKSKSKIDKRIGVLWTIRALLGPVIESLILVDRYLYLCENIPSSNTKKVWLQPLFDPILSPRNMVIMATK
ncbi:methyltransferase domain-containing protein [Cunninghamella echinulata]|nr:methyltransferase domain-containing protein [Cunninghamella echinulata]